MKKLVIFSLFIALLLPVVVSAADPINLNLNYPSLGGFDINEDQQLEQIVVWVYTLIVTISGFAAFLMITWGGIKWMTSSGDPSKTSDAQDKIKKALLGLLLVLASFLILRVINPDLVLLANPGG
jgi:formate hydrogenlyase subunit 3/multisubunit Na+/H+ antiporter MnhD subunit